MSLPRFFQRNADALLRVTDLASRGVLEQRLLDTTIALRVGDHVADDSERTSGFLLAVDLASRLYPRIALHGPSTLMEVAQARAEQVNPAIEILDAHDTMPTLAFELPPPPNGVAVAAYGWNVVVDDNPPGGGVHGIACLAAATIGMSELFRAVFADAITHPRTGPTPAAWNLITCGDARDGLKGVQGLDIGRIHIAGCGAVGQAAVLALRASGASGILVAVDPESIELSNLQRYVLTDDTSVGEAKVKVIDQALEGTTLRADPMEEHWTAEIASDSEVVLVAVDTARDRIGVQSGLPGRIYNAYTDRRDLGWSRHEQFGNKACLACLYWPTGPGLSRAEQIAELLDEAPARMTGYLVTGVPVGKPLPQSIKPPRGTAPAEVVRWQQHSMIDDVATRLGIEQPTITEWRDRTVEELYREGICGGGFIQLADTKGARQHIAVPLAHQSALAGIMLALQLITAQDDELRLHRPHHNEGRVDLLRTPVPYTVERARTGECLCFDDEYVKMWRERWQEESGA